MLESNLKKRSDRAMAQKDEIHKLDSKIDTQVALLQARIEQSKADIIKWCITSQVAVGGMIVALVKLL